MRQKIVIVARIVILFAVICISVAGNDISTESAEMESIGSSKPRIPGPTMSNFTEAEIREIHLMNLDSDERYLLARIAMAEAEGEGTEGKAMVIMTVLNRIWSNEFPATIEEVIFEDGQFASIQDGRFDTVEPDEECWEALRMIMVEKWDESEGALYFEAAYNGENTWHSRNLEYIKTVGGHIFYR